MALSIAIFAKQETPAAISLAEEIAVLVESAAQTVWFDPLTAVAIDRHPTPLDEFAAADLIVSIGGDGTFLFAAATAGSTPIVGVNLGEVGFLNAVDPADAVVTVQQLLEELRAGDPLPIRHLDRLAVTGATVDPAINEIVIQAPTRGAAVPLTLTIDVDEERYLRTTADGVMVATSTGSSAYNLSEDWAADPSRRPRDGGDDDGRPCTPSGDGAADDGDGPDRGGGATRGGRRQRWTDTDGGHTPTDGDGRPAWDVGGAGRADAALLRCAREASLRAAGPNCVDGSVGSRHLRRTTARFSHRRRRPPPSPRRPSRSR
jgi:Predicted sugar kinase